MRSLYSPRVFTRSRVIGAGAVIFTVCLAATLRTPPAGADAPTLSTPLQVADALDKIVQPRFQRNAGQFGPDRIVMLPSGHTSIDEIDGETPSERRKFLKLREARRSYVVGILHVVHKPGSHLDTHDASHVEIDPKPSTDVLFAVNSTYERVDHSINWAEQHLTRVLTPYAPVVKRGKVINVDYGGWFVALRPIRAEHSACISCHVGSHRGDTLGVMIYAVNKSRGARDTVMQVVTEGSGA
ncbi:hypothetical protein CCAX7_22480 [Capsulimonas corticalis]|uniref:Uncharacterized protein n=1 Tax=Capsulimonas corticalis TaxID=2219043 RepID=A0A402D2E1_9BACT|nr:hypothetical protein [Capsulimonas corticalis]BDI30197.1 hypothetical protein CCAX7_22480 [Capsulimonas corticalis]